MDAQVLTGHRSLSDVCHWVTVAAFLSFFCRSNVTKTQSDKWRDGELWSRISPSVMKAIFLMDSCFVTFAYSHKRITQKWAAPASLPIVWYSSVEFEEKMRRRMQKGRAFCCTSFGSSFLYDLSWSSASRLGSCCPFSLKTAATWLRVSETVLSARGASRGQENCPWCTAMAKPPMILIWWVIDMSSRKRLSPAVLWVADPRPSFVVECVSANCCLAGSHSRIEVSHEMILFGGGTISKYCGS